jgi:hydrogenase maturation protease
LITNGSTKDDENTPMKRALVLACGNPLRGDDAVALHIAKALVTGFCDEDTLVYSQHQWLPEMAETISEVAMVIFVDASIEIPAGEVAIQHLTSGQPVAGPQVMTHEMNPLTLLAMSRELYGKVPDEAFLVSVGGASFELSNQLSESARHAVPVALDHVKAILSGVSFPEPIARTQRAPS